MEQDNKEIEILGHALNMAGIHTDSFTREMIVRLLDVVREKGGETSVKCVSKVEADLCDKYNLDFKTKMPYKHENKKILIASVTSGTIKYLGVQRDLVDDPKEAHDYKTEAFAERMIAEHKHTGVIIVPYYS